MATEWAVRLATGAVFACTSERHARGLMSSTSVVLGPLDGRTVVCREVGEWQDAFWQPGPEEDREDIYRTGGL